MANPKAQVEIAAQNRMQKAFDQAGKQLKGLDRTVQVATRAFTGLSVAGLAGGVALAAITKASFASQDALAKMADRLGETTINLAAMRHQSQLTGVGVGVVDKALEEATKRLGQFNSTGSGEAGKWLQKLNLDTAELARLRPTELFQQYSEAIRGMSDRGQQLAAISALMGDESRGLINVVNEGRSGFEAARTEVEKYALALSRVDAAKVEAANDAMFRVQERMKGLGNVVASETAPIITAISNQFLLMSGDADTMHDRVRSAIDGIATGVGVVADGIHGWRMLFGTAEVAALRVQAALADEGSGLADTALYDRIRDLTQRLMPQMVDQLEAQRRPADAIAEANRLALEAAESHLATLTASDKPSALIAQNLAKARVEAEASARAVAANRENLVTRAVEGGDTSGQSTAAEDAERAALERNLEQVHQFTLSREQVELDAHSRRMEIVRTAFEAELIEEERFRELSIQIAERAQERITEITLAGLTERQKFEQMSADQKAATVLGNISNITAGVAQSNKTLFKINQAAALAHATVALPPAIIESFKNNGGWPWGGVAATAMAAAGAAQIASIKSTSFGGGTTPSLAGTTGSVGGQPVPPALPQLTERDSGRRSVTVDMSGANFYGPGGASEFARTVTELLSSEMNDRDVIVIQPNSRQAAAIRGS